MEYACTLHNDGRCVHVVLQHQKPYDRYVQHRYRFMTFFSNDPYFRTTRPKNGEVKIPIDLAWTNICSIKTQFELLRQCPSGGGAGQVCWQLQAQSYQTLPEEKCTEEQLVVESHSQGPQLRADRGGGIWGHGKGGVWWVMTRGRCVPS